LLPWNQASPGFDLHQPPPLQAGAHRRQGILFIQELVPHANYLYLQFLLGSILYLQ
jgi:hypothetical protein